MSGIWGRSFIFKNVDVQYGARPFSRNHFIASDTFPAEVAEAMKKDLEELVGKRVRIGVSEPIEPPP